MVNHNTSQTLTVSDVHGFLEEPSQVEPVSSLAKIHLGLIDVYGGMNPLS